MRHVMQQWQNGTGEAAPPVFDLAQWRRGTALKSFGVELLLSAGRARVELERIGPDGQPAAPLAELACRTPGSAISPLFDLRALEGVMRPVVVDATDDAEFELRVFTESSPELSSPSLAKVVAGPAVVRITVGADTKDGIELARQPIGALGIGLNHLLYGSSPELSGASHICLVAERSEFNAETEVTLLSLLRFLSPGRFVAGSGWICASTTDIHRVGLPWPGTDDCLPEYGARLRHLMGEPVRLGATADLPLPSPILGLLAALRVAPDTLARHHKKAVRAALKAGDRLDAVQRMDAFDAVLREPIDRLLAAAPPGTGRTHLLRGEYTLLRLRLIRQVARFEAVLPRLRAEMDSYSARFSGPRTWSLVAAGETDPERLSEADPSQTDALEEVIRNLVRKAEAAEARLQKVLDQQATLKQFGLDDPDRFAADIDRSNRLALSFLRRTHAGRRGVIIGNGPSLQIADLGRLKSEVTFASNKIYLAYDQTDWRPTYYSVEDHLVLFNNRERIDTLQDSFKIFPANMRDFGYHAADTLFIPFLPPSSSKAPLSDPDFPGFASDLTRGVFWGSTIVYTQIQMAVHMGCSVIVLIGVDHSYMLPKRKEGAVYIQKDEVNHFHKDYRKPGELWHQPNLPVLERSYARARQACEARGIRIVNASRKTELDVFERADFDSLFPPVE